MNKRLIVVLLLLSCAFIGKAQEARLLRFPSTNGKEIVFTYAGDLYKVPIKGGEAERLTSHIGTEIFARFSPDGQSIAFTGQYDGNTEVYLMPSVGGEPTRLTFTSTNERDDLGDRMGPNNIVITWNPDGKSIVFRNRIGDGFEGKLQTISSNGGMSEQIPLPEGGFCSFSPDGKKLAYNRVMREFRTWKYYRGGMADDVWIYDPSSSNIENITNNVGQDIFPMWIGDEIFFLSDRDRTMNMFVYNTRTKQTEKVTNYTEYDIKFPSTNGSLIVYENGGYIYVFDAKTRKSEKVNISLKSDNIYARDVQMHVAENITSASISADGNRIVVAARGEVFDVPVIKGVTRCVTHTPGANDREATWSPDSKYMAYISDITGETEVWIQPAEGGEPIQLTKGNDTYIRGIQWRPDSKKILYTDRKNRIVEVDVATKTKQTIVQEPRREFYFVGYSPDNQWITYTRPAENDMDVVYVYNLNTKKEIAITERWYNSGSPAFSNDGKYLIFTSERDLNPIYSRNEWNYVYTNSGALYIAMLSKDTPSPFLPTDGEVADDKPNNASKGSEASKGEPQKKGVAVTVDAEGIFSRIVKIPVNPGSYYNIYSDGKKIWYSSGRSMKVFDLKDLKEETVAEGVWFEIAANGKNVLFSKRDKIYVESFPCVKAKLDKPVDLSNMVSNVNYPKEWAQIFDEVWRAFRDGFYLENMHGADWNAIKTKYSVLLPHVKTRLDLNYVIGEMIGELACGHAYVNPGDLPRPERISMGLLGAELSRDKSGFYRIDRIIQGAPYSKKLRSPLTEVGLNIKEGDFIVAINGVSTHSVDNIYRLLIGKADVLTELSINTAATEKGARKVVVTPINDEYPLYHYNWVQDNIRKVEKATNGRVGYIYIPDMSVDGLNEFARYYYPQLDKEALIIDDRANGGGNVSPMIIERLLRKPYRLTMYRNSSVVGTIPDATQYGPKVLLINKYSASDGDLFPWSFKANNLGKVIGTRTWGGIIGISGSLPYIDGTDVRVPFFTNFDAKTGQWIVENHGVEPDIFIDNNPIKEQMGEDEQLNKAIEVILEELKTRKPLPKVPAPRTYKDLGV